MDNKDKIIEEMAMIMCENNCEECRRESIEFYGNSYDEDTQCLFNVGAERLYNAGYRKITDSVVLTKEKYERLKTQLRIKTNEANWRANQLQALDKDFEVLEKVVKCKNCKWLVEKHYEENGEKPYIKLVCMLTKRQCQLDDFCSYGEKK